MKKLAIFLMLCFPGLGFAADRYASTSGSGSTCSIGSPCTFATAISGAAANDQIYLRTGTYSSPGTSNPASGTGGNYTTISNYNGETVTVTGPVQFYSSTVHHIKWLGTGSRVFKINTSGASDESVIIGNGSHHIWFENMEITGATRQGIFLARIADQTSGFNTIRNNWIHAHGTGNQDHCMYIESHDNLVEYNKIDTCTGYGIHQYNGYAEEADNNTYRYNEVFGNATVTGFSTGQAIISRGNNNKFYGNVLRGGLANSAVGLDISRNSGSGNIFYNNTIYEQAIGISIAASSTASVVKNNVIANNTSNFENSGTGVTKSNNFCTTSGGTTNCDLSGASAGFVDAASNVFSLAAGSALIDAGTTSIATGITACSNGSAPDVGAIETLGTPTAIVNAGTATITVPNNCTNQMLPASSVTGWTFKRNTGGGPVNDVVVSNSRSGSNSFAATLTDAFAAGNTCTFSYSQTGNTTSDNGVGGATTNNQEVLAFTDSSCTNTTAGGGGSVGLSHWRVYLLQGSSDTAWIPVSNCAADFTNCTVPPGAKVWIRGKLLNNSGSDYPAFNYRPKWRRNGGTYYALSDGFDYGVACTNSIPPVCAVDIPGIRMLGTKETQLGTVVSNASATTADQLTSDASNVACVAVLSTSSIPSLTLTNSTEAECAHAIQIATTATPGDTYEMCPYTDTDTALTCSTPIKLTVGSYASVR